MRYGLFTAVVFVLFTVSGCGGQSSPRDSDSIAGLESQAVPDEISPASLGSAVYTLVDPTVRRVLAEAGQGFQIRASGGTYEFPPSVLLGHYRSVTVHTDAIAYGDLTGDGIAEAVIPVTVGTEEFSRLELAVFSASGGKAYQRAAFPLGHAVIKNVSITDGKIRVSHSRTALGDPGPTKMDLLLELPEK